MPDAAAIIALASNVKTAIDIGKVVIAAKGQFDTAELKLKLADMIAALASARIEIAEVQDEIRAKDDQIRELENALENREEVVKHWDAYYTQNNEGKATGHPYCMTCWERNHKLYHLMMHRSGGNACITCRAVYDAHRTRDWGANAPPEGPLP